MADFNTAIDRLRIRARRSRMIFFAIGGALIYMVGAAFYVTVSDSRMMDVSFVAKGPTAIFEKQIQNILERNDKSDARPADNDVNQKSAERKKKEDGEFDTKLEQYKEYLSITKDRPVPTNELGFLSSGALSHALISLGLVVFGVLMIQILVMFMRYYARLAELYEAQADALDASSGDAELAYKFMEQFSPNSIEIGKAPGTLYEKALETIQDVAKSKAQK